MLRVCVCVYVRVHTLYTPSGISPRELIGPLIFEPITNHA